MKIYLVGGAVRDSLLEIPYSERDWVVVGATDQAMLDQGYRRADERFPVFLHPQTGEEYALARRETKTGPGYKGFAVDTSPEVTLEQDLARRDLTINAMAQDETGKLIDPYDGKDDLDAGLLRHVTPAFSEDPVRLLRIARFAAKLGRWGFRVAHGTQGLLKLMAASDDLIHLQPERIWREMKRALGEEQPWRFFEVLRACGALPRLIPELDGGVAGNHTGHAAAPEAPPMGALRRCVEAGGGAEMRFAVLLADSLRDDGDAVAALCRRLRAERVYREALSQLVRARSALRRLDRSDAATLLNFVQAFGGLKSRDGFEGLLLALAALHPEHAEARIETLRRARDLALAVSAGDLARSGLEGADFGAALRRARLESIERGLDPKPDRARDESGT